MKGRGVLNTTHEMIVDCIEVRGILKAIAIDARGLYITTPHRIGRPETDANRSKTERHRDIRQLTRLGIDTRALYEANRHRITEGRCCSSGS